jgi:hypothetical protein
MAINKVQGQVLKLLEIYLPSPVSFRRPAICDFSRTSSFNKVASAVIEGHRQLTENAILKEFC